jgi:hypothetical protein
MTRNARIGMWLAVLALAAGLVFVLSACGKEDHHGDDDTGDDTGDDDTGPDVQDLLDEGRYWLGVGEGNRAQVAFKGALDQVPDHPEALYGLTLADMLSLTDAIGLVKDYLSSIIESGGPVKGDKGADDPNSIYDRLLELIVGGLILDKAQDLRPAAETLQATADPGYTHDGIPIIVDFERETVLSGHFGRAELYGETAYADLIYGLFGHAVVLSLEMDFSLVYMIMDVDFSDPKTGIGDVIDILKLMLADPGHPTFLTMTPDQVEVYKTLGPSLGDGMDAFLSVWPTIDLESDPTGNIMQYVDANGNGARDADEVYALPYFGTLTSDDMALLFLIQDLALQWRNAFWDETPKDIHPGATDPLRLAALNPILAHFGLPAVIPDSLEFPVGEWYANPRPTQIRDFVQKLVDTLDPILPGSGQYESK